MNGTCHCGLPLIFHKRFDAGTGNDYAGSSVRIAPTCSGCGQPDHYCRCGQPPRERP